MNPTSEQEQAILLALEGGDLAIEALAGTGKTSTLELMAAEMTGRGQYIAFNKAIVKEAKTRFPAHVKCSTAHSLAYGAIIGGNSQLRARLFAPNPKTWDVAKILRTDPVRVTDIDGAAKVISAGGIAQLVTRAIGRFCKSTDEHPNYWHVSKLDGLSPDGNSILRNHVAQYLARAWKETISPTGQLAFDHDTYLKLWALTKPTINADFIFVDEAQDLDPIMLEVAELQRGKAQLIFVGDQFQAIYEWRGAVNAMEKAPVDERTFLTQSFRFGPAIAEQANKVLGWLGAEVKVEGTDTIESTFGPLSGDPNAILCRTNAGVIEQALTLLTEGKKVAVVGGVAPIISFARAAERLIDGKPSDHPELMGFETWSDAVRYASDPQNDAADLKRFITLVETFTVRVIIDELNACTKDEAKADITLSTAHKAKGRQWSKVRLHTDFKSDPAKLGPEEYRLLYVAVTRAQHELDAPVVNLIEAARATAPIELEMK